MVRIRIFGKNTTIAAAAKELWQRATVGTGFGEKYDERMISGRAALVLGPLPQGERAQWLA
jgi:hypothetical protein